MAGPQGLENARENSCRPYWTCSFIPFLPGTTEPGFHMPPLRGWDLVIVVQCFAQDSVLMHSLKSGGLGYVCGLRALLAFGDFELDFVAFLQAFVALGRDRAVMNKDV